ncbi:MAG: hypothetical protein A3I68_06475 [Candidatus Melainabacteria bacterium RIFCSPLOWO2_02_FULL_35_15]|nr:MAG: hypothetical protein A3I68_06475 [Candidatus Melainabacteria bacterium RIFCSPLOWO2_02_FULL_35_15]
MQTFIKHIEFDPFNKCITVEAYCDPLSAWKHIDKQELLSNSKESVSGKLSYFEEHCGGRHLTWTHKIKDYRLAG